MTLILLFIKNCTKKAKYKEDMEQRKKDLINNGVVNKKQTVKRFYLNPS